MTPHDWIPPASALPVRAREARCLAFLVVVLVAPAASAASFVVTTLADSGAGSLRAEITSANASPGSTITFGVTGTIALQSKLPDVTASVTITGPGPSSLVVSGATAGTNGLVSLGGNIGVTLSGMTFTDGHGSAIGNIDAGVTTTALTLSNMVIQNGQTTSAGGGVFARGPLIATGCVFSGNTVAIYSEGTTTISDSTFTGNTSAAAAIFLVGGTLAINRSTFSGNVASRGVIYLVNANGTFTNTTIAGGTGATAAIALIQSSVLTLVNSTVTEAVAGHFGLSVAGSAHVMLHNTILAGAGTQCVVSGTATVISQGYNLSQDATCGLHATGDLENTDPLLGALADNGGPTQTQGLSSLSLAINAGDPTGAPTTDQRGHPRSAYGGVDLGAFEFDAFPPVPVITTNPTGALLWSGELLTLTVSTIGPGPQTFRWRQNGVDAPGATALTYTKTSVASDTGSYDLVATNGAGSATSEAATVTVRGPPAITTPPQAQTLFAGQPLSLTVIASGLSLSYAWLKDGVPIAEATSATYALPTPATTDSGSYAVVVTNPAGEATSDPVVVVVAGPPVITVPPASQELFATQPVTLAVTAVGVGLRYAWTHDGAPVPDVIGPNIDVAAATAADAGSYVVTVSNDAGVVASEPAIVIVDRAPMIVTPPVAQVLIAGAALELGVVATGEGLTYAWHRDGQPLPGADGDTYRVTAATAGDAGSYVVIVSNPAGDASSEAVAVAVHVPPVITQSPTGVALKVGEALSLTVVASGEGLTYGWQKDGQPVDGATEATYLVNVAALADAGVYKAIVTNDAGTVASDPATVTVAEIVPVGCGAGTSRDGTTGACVADVAAGGCGCGTSSDASVGLLAGLLLLLGRRRERGAAA